MGPIDTVDSNNVYIGACKKCGECYEARSAVEDLEGVTFGCRKLNCDGKVVLSAHRLDHGDLLPPEPPSPRRFC